MEQDESADKENETPVLREVDQFLQIEGVVALGSVTRAHIIDFVRSDLVERDQSRDTQHGGGKEYGVVRKIGAERAHERGGHGIPGPGEAVISSDAALDGGCQAAAWRNLRGPAALVPTR